MSEMLDASILNEDLRKLYRSVWPQLEKILNSDNDLSWPLLIYVSPSYVEAPVRVMIVGQQTYEWGFEKGKRKEFGDDPTQRLMEEYDKFALGWKYRGSPFCRAVHVLRREIILGEDPDSKNAYKSLLWSNLIKVDQRNRPPELQIEEAVRGLGLLQREIEITRPQAIVFFTGPYYEDRLHQTFPNLKLQGDKKLAELKHPALPRLAYRTYHPTYLRLSGQWNVIKKIAGGIKSASSIG